MHTEIILAHTYRVGKRMKLPVRIYFTDIGQLVNQSKQKIKQSGTLKLQSVNYISGLECTFYFLVIALYLAALSVFQALLCYDNFLSFNF